MLFVKSAHQYFQWGSLKVFMFILYKDEYSLLFLDKKMFGFLHVKFFFDHPVVKKLDMGSRGM